MVVLVVALIITGYPISKVEFVGNTTLSARSLRSEITSTRGREYNELDLNYDVGRIIHFYRSYGYFSTVVVPETATSDTFVTVIFKITEGTRPEIQKIVVEGAPPEELGECFKLRAGDYFIQEKIQSTATEIEDYYKDRGHAFATVTSAVLPDSGVLSFSVEKGVLQYVRQVEVRGLGKTRPNVVYREIELKHGDVYNKSRVYNSQRRIYALGFFSTLKVDMLKVQSDSVDLVFNVKELKSRILNFGAGITLPFSFLISFGIEELNLANIGHRVNLSPLFKFNIHKEWEAKVEGRYTLPYVSGWGLQLSLLPYVWFEENNDFARYTRGNEFRITKVFTEDVALNVSHQYKYVSIEPKVTLPDTIKGVTNSIKLQFLMDRRDEFFNPRKGLYFSPMVEYAGGIFGGANNFVRMEAEERVFINVFNNTFAQRFKFGLLVPTDGIEIYEKYYIGGQYTLRGYPEKSVGPDSIGSERYGNILLNLNLEYRMLLPYNFGVVGFFDAGYVGNDLQVRDSEYFKMTAGVGLRYFTPIGPMRLDLGFPLKGTGRELYFGIYHTF